MVGENLLSGNLSGLRASNSRGLPFRSSKINWPCFHEASDGGTCGDSTNKTSQSPN
jgi:hypothetical protein